MTRDVTDEVLRHRQKYGGSENTNPTNLAANKSLVYAAGNSIHSPVVERVTVVPSTLTFTNEVGLFGAENTFIKVDLNITETPSDQKELQILDSDGYLSALISDDDILAAGYNSAATDYSLDLTVVNDYEPATISDTIPPLDDPIVDIVLENLGTGNIYIDNHLDVSLYGPNRRPISDDLAYVRAFGFFYIGIHARKTRRLPYKVRLTLGSRYIAKDTLETENQRYFLGNSD